jgi:hypothetical protein
MKNEKWALRRRKLSYVLAFFVILLIDLLIVLLIHPTKTATLLLQGLTVFVQTVIAVSAVWGNEIRALFFGPKLVLSLDCEEGQLTHTNTDRKLIRYFHLRVQNKRVGTPAIDTQVILNSIVPPHKEGTPKPLAINGRLPFPWKFGQGRPYSIIGPDDFCDLAKLPEGGKLEVAAERWMLVENALDIQSGEKTTVEIIAIAVNGQSKPLKLDIFWDGQWPESDEEVTKHIKIEPASRGN